MNVILNLFASSQIPNYVYRLLSSYHLIRSFMPGKQLVTTTHWRCIQNIWVDRAIGYINDLMLVCLKLMLLSRYENRMMSWDPLIHSIWKRCTTRVDTTINRCNCMRWQTDGMTEYKLRWSDSYRCLFHSVQNALNYGSCSNDHLSWTRLSKSNARKCRNTSWLARSTIAFSSIEYDMAKEC